MNQKKFVNKLLSVRPKIATRKKKRKKRKRKKIEKLSWSHKFKEQFFPYAQ